MNIKKHIIDIRKLTRMCAVFLNSTNSIILEFLRGNIFSLSAEGDAALPVMDTPGQMSWEINEINVLMTNLTLKSHCLKS